MSTFINPDFLLGNKFARELYHESAENLPIIDYHCHLIPQQVAENHKFADITEVWLGGDHYKWRALRGNGVDEDYITGGRSSREKFEKMGRDGTIYHEESALSLDPPRTGQSFRHI